MGAKEQQESHQGSCSPPRGRGVLCSLGPMPAMVDYCAKGTMAPPEPTANNQSITTPKGNTQYNDEAFGHLVNSRESSSKAGKGEGWT